MARIPGDFVPLDVRYRRDRAIRTAGIAAELLYIRSLAFAKGNDTGGVIEDYDLPDLAAGMADPEGTVAALVRVGLWVQIDAASWAIRSWEKWNPTRDGRADGLLGNHNRWHRDRGMIAEGCEFCPPVSAPPPPDMPTDIAPESPPISGGESQTRVEESRGEESREATHTSPPPPKRGSKGTRLPDGWEPPETLYQSMLTEQPTVNIDAEHRKFVDHWKSQPGSKGVKLDWDATWRNWMRRAAEFAPRHLRAVGDADGYPDEPPVVNGPPEHLVTGGGLFDQ